MKSALGTLMVALLLAVSQAAFADTTADTVQVVDPGLWSTPAPGPAGVAYNVNDDTIIVVDSDRNNLDPFDGVNLWAYSLASSTVSYTGILPTDEPTGVDYDPVSDLLFVSDDNPGTVFVMAPGADTMFGTGDDPTPGEIDMLSFGSSDTEDPAFDPVSGHLFVLSGTASLIYNVDPVNAIFGDGDDTASVFGIPPDPGDPSETPEDWEALAYDPASGNLIAGAKFDGLIYEFTTAGIYVQKHDTSSLSPGVESLSGLGAQPLAGLIPVSYWVADRGGSQDEETLDGLLHRITFGPAPDLPQAAPVLLPIATPIDVDETTLATFDTNATDVNIDDTLTFSLTGAPVGAAIHPTTGVFTWTPSESQGGSSYPMTVVVKDDGVPMMSDNQAIQINVAEVNSPPSVFNPGPLLRAEQEDVVVTMFGSDSDIPADTLTWSATGLPPGLSIHPTTGKITGVVSIGAAAASPYGVTVTLTDNGAPPLAGFAQFLWNITDDNRAPVLDPIGDKSVPKGELLFFNASASDSDGDGLIFSLIGPPSGASITQGGTFTWTPSQNPGEYSVTIRVTDTGVPALIDDETIKVTVLPEASPDPYDPFTDDDGHIFENSIEWLAIQGITSGCNPPANTLFCPDDKVTRGQMAAFLVRALGYSDDGGGNKFGDTVGHIFEDAIDKLATAGVTKGCNPPANTLFCPDSNVTRGQMAAFLVRALGYTDDGGGNIFGDTVGHVFENAIDKLATAGVTKGCNPPANTLFCPDDNVTRGQMAAFLKRALGG